MVRLSNDNQKPNQNFWKTKSENLTEKLWKLATDNACLSYFSGIQASGIRIVTLYLEIRNVSVDGHQFGLTISCNVNIVVWFRIVVHCIDHLKTKFWHFIKTQTNGGQRSFLVAHWLTIPGDLGSNPSGGEKISSFIFEFWSHDCHVPLNYFMILLDSWNNWLRLAFNKIK